MTPTERGTTKIYHRTEELGTRPLVLLLGTGGTAPDRHPAASSCSQAYLLVEIVKERLEEACRHAREGRARGRTTVESAAGYFDGLPFAEERSVGAEPHPT